MALRYVLDEHLRGILWNAIQQHNAAGTDLIDAVRVGDPPDLPMGSLDPDILLWAEREQRLLVTFDRSTIPGHLAAHLAAGHHSPGVLLIRRRSTIPQLVSHLALLGAAADPATFQDRCDYIP